MESDEEDEPILQTVKENTPPPRPQPPPSDVDLLNWNTSSQANADLGKATEGIDLLNVGGDQSGMKKDPSNFDLLSGFDSVPSSAENNSNKNTNNASSTSTSQPTNLFDPFGGTAANTSAPQSNTPDLLGQFSASNLPTNSNTFSPFNRPVSMLLAFFWEIWNFHRLIDNYRIRHNDSKNLYGSFLMILV